ncbi:DUF2917 domain-containing protein [uncultured Deefgea sp.]|uniref:DUF2917 domain-containing protein n=1 Tax=uncultured Deefgea sp. TaxID=1304914 RepID=UPI00259730BC|nr:DUF2917 domain-containing protein [uncultured Deefgea sp.]
MPTMPLSRTQVSAFQAKHSWIHCEAGQLWLSHDGQDVVLERGQKYFVHSGDLIVIEALQDCRYRVQSKATINTSQAPNKAMPTAALVQ